MSHSRAHIGSLWRLITALACALVPSAARAEPPRLTVLVVVDQLSAHDFERRLPRARAGYRRLTQEGFRFLDARVDSFPTVTAAGHATLVTGAWASTHGIVGNEWFDADAGTGVQATEDARYPDVGAHPNKRGVAPTRLAAPTLGEVLKLRWPSARHVSIGGKPRASVLMAGRLADAAVWLSPEAPELTTSAYFAAQVPAWAQAVNARLAQRLTAEISWSPSGAPLAPGAQSANPPDLAPYTGTRPHRIPADATPRQKSEWLLLHPLGDELLTDAAIEALKGQQLGADAEPDLLTLSYSGYDAIVHAFGPQSAEAEAAHDALDVQLGRLLDAAERAAGKGRLLVLLTADHGAGFDPDTLPQKLSAGRLPDAFYTSLNAACVKKLGPGQWLEGPFSSGGWNVSPKQREKVLAMAPELRALALATPGVADFIAASELPALGGERGRLLQNGRFEGRSPDFLLLLEPYWHYFPTPVSSHGSLQLYDRQVPLVLYGQGIRHGTGAAAELVDVAPTLAFEAGAMPPSSAVGHVLWDALKK
ncbi:MAG: alkaline phosphatase family protein [Archangiaceae bacterium]|nr:alkaline phosphatase family protein [Archangiaceae bacterium]